MAFDQISRTYVYALTWHSYKSSKGSDDKLGPFILFGWFVHEWAKAAKTIGYIFLFAVRNFKAIGNIGSPNYICHT
jgi:hypothetical protein